MKIKIKEGFLLRKVAGDHVVVPVGEAGKVFHGMIRLNDTGAFLWEQCRKETTKEQVLQAMAEKYEVDESVAADDLDRFLQQLRNAEILEETNVRIVKKKINRKVNKRVKRKKAGKIRI